MRHGNVGGAIVLAVAGGVFPERNLKLPVQGTIDALDGGGQSGDRQCHQTPERQRLKLPVNNTGASIDVTVLAFTVRPMPAIRRAMVQPLPGR